MSFDKAPVNWFDFLLIIVIFLGAAKGRKNGMSVELMPCLQWLAIVAACAFVYKPFGDILATSCPLSHLFCYIFAYILTAIAVKIMFNLIAKGAGGKLIGSDIFGRGEFYLGAVAGMVRFSCILLAGLALLNARRYTQQEINAAVAFQKDVYGSTFFPELHNVQSDAFKDSFTGKYIKQYAGFLFIVPTSPENRVLKRKDDLP